MLAFHPPSTRNPGSAPRNLKTLCLNFIDYDGLVAVPGMLGGIRGPKTPPM